MKYYLTTPLYYVNAAPHIGHTYTTMAAETIARFKRMQGYDAVMFTGTDEHGQKVERSAEAAGKSPQEFTDVISAEFRAQWEKLNIRVDRTIRTTDPKHHKVVQDLFQRCMDNGYVYKGSYTGQYCVSDELYANEAKPGDPCPICGRITETVTEENYFFKLSAFTDKLIELYETHPEFIQPETRRNEVLAFVRQGLNDLSISRTSLKWGIPLPVEGKHVFYVWFDALIGYMSAVDGEGLWPADLHLIGKEIARFHAVFWPAFLMAAGMPLPKQVFAHGWLLFENDKMSKSRGNIVRSEPIRQVMGADALRYFLLREIVFGQDGAFSYDALIGRYNSDLANGLGNLASRTLTMIHQYRGDEIPEGSDAEIAALANETVAAVRRYFDAFEFSKGLEAVWALISAVDKYIVQKAPWKLARQADQASQAELSATLYTAAESLRIATALLSPVLPQSAPKIWAQLGMPDADRLGAIRNAGMGRAAAGPEDRRNRPRLPAHRFEGSGGVHARAGRNGHCRTERAARQEAGSGGGSRERQDRRGRFHQGGPAGRAGEVRRAGQELRQADAHEGGHRRGRTAHHCGRNCRSLWTGAAAQSQSGHRGEFAAAQVERHRI